MKRKKEELPVMTTAGAWRRITDWAGRCYACGVVGHTKGDTVCKLPPFTTHDHAPR
jgi:hypothetical protein